MELERRYAQAPAAPDAELFAARVAARLDRSWSLRQAVIGGLGVFGGLIGGVQVLGSGFVTQLAAGAARTEGLIGRLSAARGATLSAANALADALNTGSALDTRILFMSIGLAAVAGGLFVTRAIREI